MMLYEIFLVYKYSTPITKNFAWFDEIMKDANAAMTLLEK